MLTQRAICVQSKLKCKRSLPEIREPLDQLGRIVLIELYVREVHFQHR